jgi:hypothetical protein
MALYGNIWHLDRPESSASGRGKMRPWHESRVRSDFAAPLFSWSTPAFFGTEWGEPSPSADANELDEIELEYRSVGVTTTS